MKDKPITLEYSKSTKGTHVYRDDNEDAPIPTLYIKRSALPAKAPEAITITVAYDE